MKTPTLPLALYAAATGLLEPLAPTMLRSRARAGKEDPARLTERLGRSAADTPTSGANRPASGQSGPCDPQHG